MIVFVIVAVDAAAVEGCAVEVRVIVTVAVDGVAAESCVVDVRVTVCVTGAAALTVLTTVEIFVEVFVAVAVAVVVVVVTVVLSLPPELLVLLVSARALTFGIWAAEVWARLAARTSSVAVEKVRQTILLGLTTDHLKSDGDF